jgi:glucose uptake protein GlcU
MVVNLYQAVGVFVSGWFVFPIVGEFKFTFYALGGALLFLPGSIFTVLSVRLLGLSIAQGLWSGAIMIVSFLWGLFVFKDEIHNIYFALFGLALLVAGCFCIGMVKTNEPNDDEEVEHKMLIAQGRHCSDRGGEMHVQNSTFASKETTCRDDKRTPLRQKILGVICVCFVGASAGSMLAPARMDPSKSAGYVMSYGIWLMIVMPLATIVHYVIQMVKYKKRLEFHVRRGGPIGFTVGFLWGIGNAAATICSLSPLGLTVGYPLTQTALLVAGIWGMVLFKEITAPKRILAFFMSATVLISGALVLALLA